VCEDELSAARVISIHLEWRIHSLKVTQAMMKLDSLDHLVLTVKDIDSAVDFYQRVLGMTTVTFGEGRKTLAFVAQKFNLHQHGKEFEPKAERPTPASADLCFLT